MIKNNTYYHFYFSYLFLELNHINKYLYFQIFVVSEFYYLIFRLYLIINIIAILFI